MAASRKGSGGPSNLHQCLCTDPVAVNERVGRHRNAEQRIDQFEGFEGVPLRIPVRLPSLVPFLGASLANASCHREARVSAWSQLHWNRGLEAGGEDTVSPEARNAGHP